jgi:hypothetical protein
MADRLVFMTDGRAISGTPDQLLRSDDPRVVEFLSAERDDGPAPARPALAAGSQAAS